MAPNYIGGNTGVSFISVDTPADSPPETARERRVAYRAQKFDRATYETPCPACGELIEVGQSIRRMINIWVHKHCYPLTFTWQRCGAKRGHRSGTCLEVVRPGQERCPRHGGDWFPSPLRGSS